MRQKKGVYLGFRTTNDQAEKLTGIADKAGVNVSELLRLLVDDVKDVRPDGWSIVWNGRGEKIEAVQ